MTAETKGPVQHYWYTDDSERERSIAVLEAMRSYRAAEAAMHRRTQSVLGIGVNDLLALRYLLRIHGEGQTIGPKELAAYLGISSASTTALLDRLEKSGHLTRQPSPFDRRALIVVPTLNSDEDVRQALLDTSERMIATAQKLTPEQAAVVMEFLENMRNAVDQIDVHPTDSSAMKPATTVFRNS